VETNGRSRKTEPSKKSVGTAVIRQSGHRARLCTMGKKFLSIRIAFFAKYELYCNIKEKISEWKNDDSCIV
jgi:hypothetical protein